jgi:hypothetical protein
MSLLNHAYCMPSDHVIREYPEVVPTWHTSQLQTMKASTVIDRTCVAVHIPESDWLAIQAIVQAHEHAVRSPAVQDAWLKYQMISRLVQGF